MRLKNIGILLMTAFSLCGCSARYSHIDSMVKRLTVPEKTFLTITNGLSLDVMRSTLGIAARHEFTITESNANYTLVSCFVPDADGPNFWLLFRDKTMIKIIQPFSFPELLETYPYQGTTASRVKSWDIDDAGIMGRVRKIIDAPELTHDELLNALKPYNGKGMQPLNILPAFLLTGYAKRMAPQIEKGYEINEELSKRYDGCQANLGMSTEDIEKLYGKPLRVFTTKNGQTARIYGDTRYLEINSLLAFGGMAVVSDAKGQVTAIYSHQFFNDEWKK